MMPDRPHQQELTNETDEKLYALTGGGSEPAFRILVSRHLDKVWRLACNILADEKDAEDVVQEVFLSVWKKSASWTCGKARFSTWLYRVSINKAIDFKRRKARTPLPVETETINFLQEEARPPADSLLPVDVLMAQESAREMQEIILSLPPAQKKVIHLFYYREMTVPEIAQNMNSTEVAVRALLKRGRKALRETFAGQKKI